MTDNGVYSICDSCENQTPDGKHEIICMECSHFYKSLFRERPELRTCDNCIMADCEEYKERKLGCQFWTSAE